MASNTSSPASAQSLYPYDPSHALPAVFAVLVGVSLSVHIYQNLHYRFWRVTFFTFWAGTVFTAGWILRCISSYQPTNLNLYIASTILIYAGPPIYAAAEYNILGRLMYYLPMHSPMNPGYVLYFFIYLGAAVESMTAAGASLYATAPKGDISAYRTGGILLSIALVLQGAVECVFLSLVALMYCRCARAMQPLPRNVRTLCIMLYGTSTFILIRCIFRAIQSFSTVDITTCGALCQVVELHEWYLYVFEAAPMVLFTYWLNIVHPGRFLPHQKNRYLDVDGKTERFGPGWEDTRSKWQIWLDPFGTAAKARGRTDHESFWLRPEAWPVMEDGSFACGTATNVKGRGAQPVSSRRKGMARSS